MKYRVTIECFDEDSDDEIFATFSCDVLAICLATAIESCKPMIPRPLATMSDTICQLNAFRSELEPVMKHESDLVLCAQEVINAWDVVDREK